MKRLLDIILSALALAMLSPLLLLTALAIAMESGSPVLFRQIRLGFAGREFGMYKFRSMVKNAASIGPYFTQSQDPRITRVGRFIRRTSIDELPQLINVLKGDMSLIGPRPEQPSFDEQLSEQIPHYRKRYWMLPGLSGWAQVCGPAYPSSLDEAEIKLSYDLYYLRNWTIGLDLLIMAKTVKTVLKFRGR